MKVNALLFFRGCKFSLSLRKLKLMKKFYFACLIASAALFSCNKDQKVANELEGTWTVQGRTYNGVAAPASEYSGVKYTFQSCTVKDGDCDGSITVPDSTKGSVTFDIKYNVAEKGTKFTMKVSLLGIVSNAFTADILEHSKSKFVYQYLDTVGTPDVTTVETLVK